MVIFYILLFVFILFALLENTLSLKSKYYILFLGGIILILFAGLRGPGVDKDYLDYLKYYKKLPTIEFLLTNASSFFLVIKTEPTYILICSFIKTYFFNGFPVVIFFYAILGVILKLKAITKLTDLVLLSMLIYFSRLFILQDMIQIRAGVAAGFVLLSIPSIQEKNIRSFIIYFLLAVSFHYSALIIAPFFFLNPKKIDKLIYTLVIILPIILCIFKFDPVSIAAKFDFGIITEKINIYIARQKELRESVTLFGIGRIVQITLGIVFIFYSEKTGNKYAILLTKINCLGIACFYLFPNIPPIALRLSELLCCAQIILLPLLVYIIKPRIVAETIIIISSIIYLLNVTDLFKTYYTIF